MKSFYLMRIITHKFKKVSSNLKNAIEVLLLPNFEIT